jgi:collagenase-like PrtC family protease
MKYFSMPADFRTETLDRYDGLNKAYADSKVSSTYGNITISNVFGSGRNVNKLPSVDMPGLAAYVAHSRALGIDFSYTLNPSFLQNREFTPDGIRLIRMFLDELYEAGVRSVIVAMPSVMEIVRSMGGRFHMKASAICQITSPNKALMFKRMGADAMVLDETINRDFHTIRGIRAVFGEQVFVIANSFCHQDCQYRMFHYNQISGDSVAVSSEASCAYYPVRCAIRLHGELASYLKTTWIRPEDLKHYLACGIQHFKLQGRQLVLQGDPVRAVECYFKESYDGDLKNLLYLFAPSDAVRLSVDNRRLDAFLRPFVEKEGFCRRDCTQCDYCEVYARKCFDVLKTKAIGQVYCEALRQRDPFAAVMKAAGPPLP